MEAQEPREKQPSYICPLLGRILALIIAIPSPRMGYITLYSKPPSVVQLCGITQDHSLFIYTAWPSWSLWSQYLFLS